MCVRAVTARLAVCFCGTRCQLLNFVDSYKAADMRICAADCHTCMCVCVGMCAWEWKMICICVCVWNAFIIFAMNIHHSHYSVDWLNGWLHACRCKCEHVYLWVCVLAKRVAICTLDATPSWRSTSSTWARSSSGRRRSSKRKKIDFPFSLCFLLLFLF